MCVCVSVSLYFCLSVSVSFVHLQHSIYVNWLKVIEHFKPNITCSTNSNVCHYYYMFRAARALENLMVRLGKTVRSMRIVYKVKTLRKNHRKCYKHSRFSLCTPKSMLWISFCISSSCNQKHGLLPSKWAPTFFYSR